ncbi:hypothetical protein MMC06_000345 [Schaereria dolodes]|nr:hypothetical protein [Schaereria dolodes]
MKLGTLKSSTSCDSAEEEKGSNKSAAHATLQEILGERGRAKKYSAPPPPVSSALHATSQAVLLHRISHLFRLLFHREKKDKITTPAHAAASLRSSSVASSSAHTSLTTTKMKLSSIKKGSTEAVSAGSAAIGLKPSPLSEPNAASEFSFEANLLAPSEDEDILQSTEIRIPVQKVQIRNAKR